MTIVHRRPLELAAAAVDFELSANEREELDRHLAGCSLCRTRIAGLRRDAGAIEVLPVLPVSADQSARLRAAALRRPVRPAWSALRLVAVAAIVALLALAAVAVGSSLVERNPIDLSVVEPVPSAVVPAPVPPSVVPSGEPSSPPSEQPDGEPVGYEPPTPTCPAPTEAASLPPIDMSMGDGEIVIVPTIAGQTVMTCSTVNPSDFAEAEPDEATEVLEGQTIDVSVDSGWQILHWDGYDRPRTGEGTNIIEGETPEDGPSSVSVPVPDRLGDVILGLSLWIQSADGRVIANVSTAVWLNIQERVSGAPTAAVGALTELPSNVSCDSVGWPEDVPRFGTVTFSIDAEMPGYVFALADTRAELPVLWPRDEFRIAPDGTVVDEDGTVVVRDGETLEIPDGPLPDLHGYPVCVSPSRLIVLLPGG